MTPSTTFDHISGESNTGLCFQLGPVLRLKCPDQGRLVGGARLSPVAQVPLLAAIIEDIVVASRPMGAYAVDGPAIDLNVLARTCHTVRCCSQLASIPQFEGILGGGFCQNHQERWLSG